MTTESEIAAATDRIVSTYVRAASDAGVKLTQVEFDRLKRAIRFALDQGAGELDLVTAPDGGGLDEPVFPFETTVTTTEFPSRGSGRPGSGDGGGPDVGGPRRTESSSPRVPSTVIEAIENIGREVQVGGAISSGAQEQLERFGLPGGVSLPGDDEEEPPKIPPGVGPGEDVLAQTADNLKAALAAIAGEIASLDRTDLDATANGIFLAEQLATVTSALDWTLEASEGGRIRLDDGTIITSDLLYDEDPIVRGQAWAAAGKQMGLSLDAIDQGFIDLGLPEFARSETDREGDSAADANARAQANFANSLAQLGANLDIEDATTRRVGLQVERQLAGLGESRTRTTDTLNTILAGLPFASAPGKTSFTANELGAGIGGFARLAGLDPNANLLNFTGQERIDPAGLMAATDLQLGVAGPLQEVPDLRQLSAPGTPQLALPAAAEGGVPGAPSILSTLRRGFQREQAARAGASGLLTPAPEDF